jgi:DNA-binding NtrC family response regulator
MSTFRKLNVIVLDDDSMVTRLVQKFLTTELHEKIHVEAINDADVAKVRIDHHGCDILLSDIEMPECDGLEILRFAKLRNAWTQVIFMTAHSTWDRISTAIENGATDYLLKPIDRTELVHVINQECARLLRWQQAVTGTLRKSLVARH